jgi:hypothetical protein
MPELEATELAVAGHAVALSQWHVVRGRAARRPARAVQGLPRSGGDTAPRAPGRARHAREEPMPVCDWRDGARL